VPENLDSFVNFSTHNCVVCPGANACVIQGMITYFRAHPEELDPAMRQVEVLINLFFQSVNKEVLKDNTTALKTLMLIGFTTGKNQRNTN
jgi:hypothetical protein